MLYIRQESFKINKLADSFFIIIVALIATLPSGSLAGIPVKYFLLLLVFCYFLRVGAYYAKAFPFHFLGIGSFLVIYALYGLTGFGRYAINEMVLALGALLLALLVVHVIERRGLGEEGVLKIYKLSVLMLGMLKLGILVAFLISPNYEAFQAGFVDSYRNFTGSSFITMPLPYGLVRIYLQHDLIAALFPLAVIILRSSRNITSLDRGLVLFCLFIVLLGFSRFNMACYAVALLAFLWADKRGVALKLIIMLGMGLSLPIFFVEIMRFIELRFFSAQNLASDNIRFEQSIALFDLFKQAPIFGHGLGAYSEDVIRSQVAPFSYEQQLLSLLPKFGVVGSAVAISYVCYLFWRFSYWHQYYTVFYLVLFLSASAFNPYLFSSNMVVVYALLFYAYFYVPHITTTANYDQFDFTPEGERN